MSSKMGMESGEGCKEGPLRKRVNYFSVYLRYWVILRDGRVDLLNEKTRELQSSIVLAPSFTVVPHAIKGSKTMSGFALMNGEFMLARFMAESPASAAEWRKAIEAAIKLEKGRPRSRSIRRRRSEQRGEQPSYIAEKMQLARKMEFTAVDNVAGLTVYRETNVTKQNVLLKTGCIINCSTDEVFDKLLNDRVNFEPWDEWEERCDILDEQPEKHLRIEHVWWFPINVFGMSTKPRDFVLERYWMKFENGSKLITWRSCSHAGAPEDPNYVRGKLWMFGYLITPKRRMRSASEGGGLSTTGFSNGTLLEEEEQDMTNSSCWVDMCVHFSPEGWVGKMPLFVHQRWAYPLLQRLTLLREAIDRSKFMDVDYSYVFERLQSGGGTPKDGAKGRVQLPRQRSKKAAELLAQKSKMAIAETSPLLDKDGSGKAADEKALEGLAGTWPCWEETPLDRSPLRVRGANYLIDKKKIECRKAAFKLVAMDLFETEEHVTHIASRPDSLVHRLTKEAGHPFIFLVHFTIPGPPFYSLVSYFAATPEQMTVGNPFGDLLNEFLNTENKEFRDSTFKLIPRVHKGNFFVRKAVGETPAILGKKLAQEYYGDGESYFELVVDVGSSSIAGSILSVVKGYATSLEIDLAFLLEGKRARHLPEQILGSLRLVNPDIDLAVRLPYYAVSLD